MRWYKGGRPSQRRWSWRLYNKKVAMKTLETLLLRCSLFLSLAFPCDTHNTSKANRSHLYQPHQFSPCLSTCNLYKLNRPLGPPILSIWFPSHPSSCHHHDNHHIVSMHLRSPMEKHSLILAKHQKIAINPNNQVTKRHNSTVLLYYEEEER